MNENEATVEAQAFSKEYEAVLDTMARMSASELADFYKISNPRAIKEYQRWQAILVNQAPYYPALDLFDGLMYRKIRRTDLTQEESAYLKEHLYITSALYGVIPAMQPIAPHRLDFLNSLKVDGKTLKAHWKDSYNQFGLDNEVIVSLLSTEFEAIFANPIRDRFIRVKFMEHDGQRYRTHSTISKKARGAFVTKLMEEQVTDVESMTQLSFADFEYQANLSTNKELVFVKNIEA